MKKTFLQSESEHRRQNAIPDTQESSPSGLSGRGTVTTQDFIIAA